jgi:hypothetical protein
MGACGALTAGMLAKLQLRPDLLLLLTPTRVGHFGRAARRGAKNKIGEVKSLRSVRKLVLDPDIVARIGALQSRFANSECDVPVGSRKPG